MDRLIEGWKRMKGDLEVQLVAFDPPMSLRTSSNRRDTTEESKQYIRRCIAELRAFEEARWPGTSLASVIVSAPSHTTIRTYRAAGSLVSQGSDSLSPVGVGHVFSHNGEQRQEPLFVRM
jgi:hypothetical protein